LERPSAGAGRPALAGRAPRAAHHLERAGTRSAWLAQPPGDAALGGAPGRAVWPAPGAGRGDAPPRLERAPLGTGPARRPGQPGGVATGRRGDAEGRTGATATLSRGAPRRPTGA